MEFFGGRETAIRKYLEIFFFYVEFFYFVLFYFNFICYMELFSLFLRIFRDFRGTLKVWKEDCLEEEMSRKRQS